MGERLLRLFALGDIPIHDDEFFDLSPIVLDRVRGGFQNAPSPILVPHAIFQPLSSASPVGLFGRLQHTLAIRRVNLIKRGTVTQFFDRISEHFLIGRAVVKPPSATIHDGNHVGSIFGDELK